MYNIALFLQHYKLTLNILVHYQFYFYWWFLYKNEIEHYILIMCHIKISTYWLCCKVVRRQKITFSPSYGKQFFLLLRQQNVQFNFVLFHPHPHEITWYLWIWIPPHLFFFMHHLISFSGQKASSSCALFMLDEVLYCTKTEFVKRYGNYNLLKKDLKYY